MGLHETWVRNCRFRSYFAFSVLPFNFTLQTLENYLSRLGNGTITQNKTLWLSWRKINVEFISNFRYWTVAETGSWGGEVGRELFAGSLCRRWQPDFVNTNIWSRSWHLLCVRLTFGPSILPVPLPTLLFCCVPPQHSMLRVLTAVAKDTGLVPGTTCMAAFCLMASVWLRLHLQSSEGPLPVRPVMPQSDQIVCLLVSWLLVVLRTKLNLFLIRSSSNPPRLCRPYSIFILHAFIHSGLSAVRWDCGSVTSPPTSETGGRWGELFGVLPQLACFFWFKCRCRLG